MRPILLRDACVVTMDPALGELSRGAVLIEGDRIAAVAPDIEAGDAETIDARGFIVIPGLINAHMHTWQTALRGAAANWTLLEYFRWVHAGLATQFRPEDIHICHVGRRAQSDQLRFDDACRLASQQPDARAHRRGGGGAARFRHSRGVLPWLAQARPASGRAAFLRDSASAA